MTPEQAEFISRLDIQWREYFHERAAILEFDCGLPREDAESLAFNQTTAVIIKRKAERKAA